LQIIQLLLGEHAVLLTACEHLERVSAHLELEPLFEVARMVESLMVQHAVNEDELVFDALPPQAAGVEDALRSMRQDHDHIRAGFEQLYECTSVAEARRHLAKVFEHSRDHFAIEERVMFALAARTLGGKRLEELGAEWARRRHLAPTTL